MDEPVGYVVVRLQAVTGSTDPLHEVGDFIYDSLERAENGAVKRSPAYVMALYPVPESEFSRVGAEDDLEASRPTG